MQAQMQQDYADTEKAISLLELVEAVYGADVTTGLMLCRAWSDSGRLEPLEKKVEHLLSNNQLSCEQRAATYYCLSAARWNAGDRIGARKAHRLYTSLMAPKAKDNDEKSTDKS